MSSNHLLLQSIDDIKSYCSSWKCELFMETQLLDLHINKYSEPMVRDIFSLTEPHMRCNFNKWFICGYQYPSHKLSDVVAMIRAESHKVQTSLILKKKIL